MDERRIWRRGVLRCLDDGRVMRAKWPENINGGARFLVVEVQETDETTARAELIEARIKRQKEAADEPAGLDWTKARPA